MRILFIAPYVPSRIRVRPFHFVKGLAKRHDVHVIALGGAEKGEIEGVDEVISLVSSFQVIPHCKVRGYLQSLLSLPTPSPMCTAFCRSGAARRAVDSALADGGFDVVHIEHLRAAHFAPPPGSVPVVFDAVDCLAGLFRQMAKHRKNPIARLVMAEEAFKLRRYEPAALNRFDRVLVTSDSEREELLSLGVRVGVEVIANGVDTDYFAPMDVERHPRRIVFSGKMSYRPNAQAAQWFAENVFPMLLEKWPDAEFVVVGSGPPAEIRALAERPGITVTGYVDDIRPYLASATVAVVPMRIAVGIQNKVLEAMAMGLPVVASPSVCRPLGSDCPGIIAVDGTEQTCESVSHLLSAPEKALGMGFEGRAVVTEHFSWDAGICRLEALYRELVASRCTS